MVSGPITARIVGQLSHQWDNCWSIVSPLIQWFLRLAVAPPGNCRIKATLICFTADTVLSPPVSL
jgi:hypothetical protein